MSELRTDDRNGIVSRPEDQRSAGQSKDIALENYLGGPCVDTGAAFPCAVADLDMAREFARRQDRKGFTRWIALHCGDVRNQDRLRLEYERASSEGELQAWQRCWRDGIVPQLSTRALQALRQGLLCDDKRILQGATCSPAPLACVADWEPEAADAISYALWLGDGYGTIGQLEDQFALVCMRASETLGEPTGCRYFLSWWDEQPRDVARQQLLIECDLALIGRLPPEQPVETIGAA
jgi:hypothetical protein